MTKTLNCTVVISEEICRNAGIGSDKLERADVALRGREQPLGVCTVADATSLASLLDEQAAEAEATTSAVAYDLA
jgi:adenylate cyclase